jgi:hypothetical protein
MLQAAGTTEEGNTYRSRLLLPGSSLSSHFLLQTLEQLPVALQTGFFFLNLLLEKSIRLGSGSLVAFKDPLQAC